jgi:hypothetical protein
MSALTWTFTTKTLFLPTFPTPSHYATWRIKSVSCLSATWCTESTDHRAGAIDG